MTEKNKIHSMTAFARAQAQGSWGTAICELRSVNHRYLEIRVHLPDILFELEQPLHDAIRNVVKRGKVECYLRFQSGELVDAPLQVNQSLIKRLVVASQEIAGFIKEATPLNPMTILQWPGVIQSSEGDMANVKDEIMSLVKKALQELIANRIREGEELKQLFLQRLDGIKEELEKAKNRLPSILQHQRERLLKHFSDAQVSLNSERLEQEMVLFAQKIDVAEEIDRIDTHVNEVRRVLKQGGVMGRRLDFLMQELNREANTLGAKSADVETTHASLEMKVLIEQLREQMQNIE